MDSQDETEGPEFDVDVELEEWLEKMAAEQGLDPRNLRAAEMETWERFNQEPNPDDFSWLYNSHQPLLYKATERIIRSTTLPKAYVRGRVMRNYVSALETFDPNRGMQLSSFVYGKAGEHLGRDIQRYTNVGRIPEDRSGMIDLMKNREAELIESLGRKPTNNELAEDMLLSGTDLSDLQRKKVTPNAVGTLRRELRQDLSAEGAGGSVDVGKDSLVEQQAVFLHGSLNPEQQLVLEHTFDSFGKKTILDPMELSKEIDLSPQKIRAIKKQIADKLQRYY